jgi:hypothetical protein
LFSMCIVFYIQFSNLFTQVIQAVSYRVKEIKDAVVPAEPRFTPRISPGCNFPVMMILHKSVKTTPKAQVLRGYRVNEKDDLPGSFFTGSSIFPSSTQRERRLHR